MARYKWYKHKNIDNQSSLMGRNPCAEIALSESHRSTLIPSSWFGNQEQENNRVYRTEDIRNATALTRPGPIFGAARSDTTGEWEARQAVIATRPDATISIQADTPAGIEPAYSNAYRRRIRITQDLINELGDSVVAGSSRRSAMSLLASTDVWSTDRVNTERSPGTGDDPSLAAAYMLNSIADGDGSFFNTEES